MAAFQCVHAEKEKINIPGIGYGHHYGLRLKHLLKETPEGPPSEVIEDSMFVPLNPDDTTFGPQPPLSCGFVIDCFSCRQGCDGKSVDISSFAFVPCGKIGKEMMMFIDAFLESGNS
ncbi:hypothetical protein L1887_30218 [Cichorium endivia]|nr:hypothetical protein L1887_30218 [Cichorium endivia]